MYGALRGKPRSWRASITMEKLSFAQLLWMMLWLAEVLNVLWRKQYRFWHDVIFLKSTTACSYICRVQCSPCAVCGPSWCPPEHTLWQRSGRRSHRSCCRCHRPVRCKQVIVNSWTWQDWKRTEWMMNGYLWWTVSFFSLRKMSLRLSASLPLLIIYSLLKL